MTEPFVARPRGPLPRVGAVDARSASRSGPPADAVPVSAGAAGAAGAVDPAGVAAVEDQAPEEAVVRPPRHPVLEPFAEFLDDPGVTDLFVNGGDGLFVDRGSGATRVARWRATEPEVRDLAVALIGLGGRHIDDASPCVDVRLDGGIRVHAVLPPIASGGTAISIRVPRAADVGLAGLAARGLVDARGRERLERLVADRENLLISGAGGSGNTTWDL